MNRPTSGCVLDRDDHHNVHRPTSQLLAVVAALCGCQCDWWELWELIVAAFTSQQASNRCRLVKQFANGCISIAMLSCLLKCGGLRDDVKTNCAWDHSIGDGCRDSNAAVGKLLHKNATSGSLLSRKNSNHQLLQLPPITPTTAQRSDNRQ